MKVVHIGKDAGLKNIFAELQQMIDAGEVITLAAAAKLKDGSVATAYHADFGERAELLGHMQADLAFQMVAANLEEV